MITVNIGLLGLGTVGSGVYNILNDDYALIVDRLKTMTGKDFNIVIKKILVRDIDKRDAAVRDLLTTNADDILEDESIDIVCELIGGDTLATEYMNRAIENGKHVVTANKMAIFTGAGKLLDYAKEKGVSFRYEGAVAGVIPIIRVVEDSFIADEIYELQGILNGSTNFIMTKLKEGLTYDEAIDLASEKGYLEADPTSDLEGFDPMYKLGILANLINGAFPREEDIDRVGLGTLSSEYIDSVHRENKKIKYIARMENVDGEYSYSVKPEVVDEDNPLYSIDGSLNGILFKAKNGGDIFLSGAGAGSKETAVSVLGDIFTIVKEEF